MSFLLNNPTHLFISCHLSSSGSLESIWAVMGLEHDLYNCSFTPTANYQLTLMLWEEAGLHRVNRHRHSENMQASHRKTPASGLEDKTFLLPWNYLSLLWRVFTQLAEAILSMQMALTKSSIFFQALTLNVLWCRFVFAHTDLSASQQKNWLLYVHSSLHDNQSNAVIIILICYVNVYKQKYPN